MANSPQNDRRIERDRSEQPVRRGPPPLPSAAKRRQPSPQRQPRPPGLSAATKWSAIGGGVTVSLMVAAFLVFRSLAEPKTPPASEKDSSIKQVVPSSGSESSEPKTVVLPQASEPVTEFKSNEPVVGSPSLLDGEPLPEITEAQADAEIPPAETTDVGQTPSTVAESDTGKDNGMNEDPVEDESSNSDAVSADIDGMIAAAAALVKVMNGKQAVSKLRLASRLFQKEIRPDFYLGLLHSGVGVNDAKIAETHFKKALERSPGHIATLNNLALTEIKARKFAPARNYLSLVAKSDPRPIEVDQNLGRMLMQASVLNISKDEFKKISSLNTNPAAFHRNQGWLYMPIDETPKSLAEYKFFCKEGRLEDLSCTYCGGQAHLRCKNCAGIGTVLKSGTNSQTITSPIGSTTITSPTTASLPCPTCHGRGRVDCSQCSNGRDPQLHR